MLPFVAAGMDWCLGWDEYWWHSLTILPAPVEYPKTQYLIVVVERPSPQKIMHSTLLSSQTLETQWYHRHYWWVIFQFMAARRAHWCEKLRTGCMVYKDVWMGCEPIKFASMCGFWADWDHLLRLKSFPCWSHRGTRASAPIIWCGLGNCAAPMQCRCNAWHKLTWSIDWDVAIFCHSSARLLTVCRCVTHICIQSSVEYAGRRNNQYFLVGYPIW